MTGDDDRSIATPIETIALKLSDKADWRRGKARQYPDDERNLDAAELLDRLAGEVLVLNGSAAAVAFEKEYDAIFSGEDQNRHEDVIRRWSEYGSGIGFKYFPDTGQDVLQDMVTLAKATL